jgi:hypothetical protein
MGSLFDGCAALAKPASGDETSRIPIRAVPSSCCSALRQARHTPNLVSTSCDHQGLHAAHGLHYTGWTTEYELWLVEVFNALKLPALKFYLCTCSLMNLVSRPVERRRAAVGTAGADLLYAPLPDWVRHHGARAGTERQHVSQSIQMSFRTSQRLLRSL